MGKTTCPASWYADSLAPAPAHPALAGSITADVAIIGAGYTGLSAALTLAERGYRVAVLEARHIAWGASGRNGGHVMGGFSPGPARLIRDHGEATARRLLALAEAGHRLLVERIDRHRIDCDLTWGYLHAAARPRHLRDLADEAALSARLGPTRTELWDRRTVAAVIPSDRYHGGLFDPDSGHLHPLAYARGLAAAASAAGARFYESTPVTAIHAGARPHLETRGGIVEAAHILVCCNAYLSGLLPQLTARIMPVATCMIATEQLGAAAMRACLARPLAVADTNTVLDYFRPSRDGRLLFGGLAAYSGREPGDIVAALRPRLMRIFPGLSDVAITHAWGGLVAISRNRLPQLGRLSPGLYFAQGYSGQGIVLAGLLGHLMAEAVAGTSERFDVFAALEASDFPGGWLRTPALVLAMLYFRLRDLL